MLLPAAGAAVAAGPASTGSVAHQPHPSLMPIYFAPTTCSVFGRFYSRPSRKIYDLQRFGFSCCRPIEEMWFDRLLKGELSEQTAF